MLPENIFPKKLTIIIVLFVLVIIIGFFTLRKPVLSFTMDTETALIQMKSGSALLTADQALRAIQKKETGFLFIDTRDPYEFVKGHITGAANITIQELLKKDNLKKFRRALQDSVKVVLYGNDESSVNGAVQILRQSGYSNIMDLEGGYPAYQNLREGGKQDSIPRFKAEARWYDYQSFLKKANAGTNPVSTQQPVNKAPQKKVIPKPSASKGEGC